MAATAPKIVFGTAGIASFDADTTQEIYRTLEQHNVKDLDTASVYTASEATLGKTQGASRFIIHTKAPGFSKGSLSKESIAKGMEQSLKDLGLPSVDVYFLHCPDNATPIEETLAAIQDLYTAGKFKRFGLSNYLPTDVQKIYDIQKANGAVLPTVFQGNYNAVSRHIEGDLFPLLRKLGIAFFAYSPIAGGFLVKTASQLRNKTADGRFGPDSRVGPMYNDLYIKETLLTALEEWEVIAKDAGATKAALAYRWIAYHSALKQTHGDAVIIGASKVTQLEETLTAVEQGPLDEKIAKRVDDIWKKVESEAPLDNYHSFAAASL